VDIQPWASAAGGGQRRAVPPEVSYMILYNVEGGLMVLFFGPVFSVGLPS